MFSLKYTVPVLDHKLTKKTKYEIENSEIAEDALKHAFYKSQTQDRLIFIPPPPSYPPVKKLAGAPQPVTLQVQTVPGTPGAPASTAPIITGLSTATTTAPSPITGTTATTTAPTAATTPITTAIAQAHTGNIQQQLSQTQQQLSQTQQQLSQTQLDIEAEGIVNHATHHYAMYNEKQVATGSHTNQKKYLEYLRSDLGINPLEYANTVKDWEIRVLTTVMTFNVKDKNTNTESQWLSVPKFPDANTRPAIRKKAIQIVKLRHGIAITPPVPKKPKTTTTSAPTPPVVQIPPTVSPADATLQPQLNTAPLPDTTPLAPPASLTADIDAQIQELPDIQKGIDAVTQLEASRNAAQPPPQPVSGIGDVPPPIPTNVDDNLLNIGHTVLPELELPDLIGDTPPPIPTSVDDNLLNIPRSNQQPSAGIGDVPPPIPTSVDDNLLNIPKTNTPNATVLPVNQATVNADEELRQQFADWEQDLVENKYYVRYNDVSGEVVAQSADINSIIHDDQLAEFILSDNDLRAELIAAGWNKKDPKVGDNPSLDPVKPDLNLWANPDLLRVLSKYHKDDKSLIRNKMIKYLDSGNIVNVGKYSMVNLKVKPNEIKNLLWDKDIKRPK